MTEQELTSRVRRAKLVQSIPAAGLYDLGVEFTSNYQELLAMIDDWCGTPPPKPWPIPQPMPIPIPHLVRLFALRTVIDDYCGTYPHRPPIPPRFESLMEHLNGIEDVLGRVEQWSSGSAGVPGVVALTILSDDINDWCGTRPPRWPRPKGLLQDIQLQGQLIG